MLKIKIVSQNANTESKCLCTSLSNTDTAILLTNSPISGARTSTNYDSLFISSSTGQKIMLSSIEPIKKMSQNTEWWLSPPLHSLRQEGCQNLKPDWATC